MAGDRCLSIDCFQLFKRQKEKVMGGCHLKSRFGEKLQLGKNKSFVVLKDTITKEKNAYSILFCFDEEVPNSIISDVSQTTEKESYTITLMKKKGESRIKNSLSSIGRSIQYAFSKANEQGFTKIFIDEPKDLISKDITFILQQFIRMLLYFDAKRSFPQIKSIYFDWSGVDMKELIKKVEKDLSRI